MFKKINSGFTLFAAAIMLIGSCSTKETPSDTQKISRLFPIKENSKWGYMDETGKTVIAPAYDYAWDFSEGLGRIKLKGKFGFVNMKGDVVVQPSLAYADNFHDGYARINTKDTTVNDIHYDGYDLNYNWTFVDTKGVIVTETFAKAEQVNNGVAAIKDDPAYESPYTYVILSNGSITRQERVTEAIFNFNGHDLAPASDPSTNKLGMIDKNEQWIVQPVYDNIEAYSEGLAAARKDNVYGYINTAGNWVYQQVVSQNDYYYLPNDFKPFSQGLAAVKFGKDSYGYLNKQGKPAFTQRFKTASTFTDEGYAVVSSEAGTGLIDTKGNFVIKPHLDIQRVERGIVIYQSKEGVGAKLLASQKDIIAPTHSKVEIVGDLIRITESGATSGYINRSGEFVIAPQFSNVWEFSNGKAIVQQKEKYVYIDKTGKITGEVPEDKLPYADPTSSAMYAWSDESGKFGFTKSGEEGLAIPARYDFATSFEGNIARVNIGATLNEDAYMHEGGKWGLIDTQGNAIIPVTYELILPFVNNLARFNSGGMGNYTLCEAECAEEVYYGCEGGKWGILNSKGEVIVEAKYDRLIPFGKNYLALEADSFGIIDERGNLLYPFQLYVNYLKASEQNKAGVMGTDGKWIVPASFDDINLSDYKQSSPFTEGLVLAKSGNFWGAVDASAQFVIPATYEEMRAFSNGKAAVKVNGKWGFISKENQLIVKPEFQSVRDFQGDVAIVQIDGNTGEGVINSSGQIIFQPTAGVNMDYEGFKEGLCVIYGSESSQEAGEPITTCGVINNKGKVLFNKSALNAARIQPGGLLYVVKNNKWAIASHDGAMITGFDYDWIEPYEGQELIRVNVGGEVYYDEMGTGEDCYGGIWGMMDKAGNIRVPFKFAELGAFHEGLASARSNEDLDLVGYVDFSGKSIKESKK
jgi:hypothetical protein